MTTGHKDRQQPGGQRLARWIGVLGVLNAAGFAARAVTSYGLASVAPFGVPQPREAEVFDALGRTLRLLGPGIRTFVSGHNVLARREIFLWVYSGPLLLESAVFVALLILLVRYRGVLEPSMPRRLFRWSLAFVAVSLLASPVLVQDFWLSVGWGRMVAAGLNPYHTPLSAAMADRLPVDNDLRMQMTYGPLWALISGAVAWLGHRSVPLEAALFKVLLAGAWIASLRLVWLLLQRHSLWQQCTGLVLFGWMPSSVTESVAEGHNDIVLVCLLLLWLYQIERGRPFAACLALAASVLVKYVTAPLFVLDFLHWRFGRGRRPAGYLPCLFLAGTFVAVTTGVFYRSAEFFSATVKMARWRFLAPSDAVFLVGDWLGELWGAPWMRAPFLFLGVAVFAVFPLLAFYGAVSYLRRPGTAKLWEAVLAVMSAVLFCVVGHVWPWFVVWVLAVGALVAGSGLTRWVVGVALAAPFATLILFTFPGHGQYVVPTLVLNGSAALWFVFAPRRWFAPVPLAETGCATAAYDG
ncbi:MAG: hypothetical protein ACE5I7_02235 [Candidatus Binatia bacterium]